ncbi:NACHT, LRR and PYD domains-containing protein 3-like isoform X2 [Polypterus senegalus]|uniref:NACHT, LRR and PYD domains-containing protein 3-like isoform X2 n=1 Tax=Polypterus senegalus TaxID=55291 RepID=UPI0019626123|nr:NACHT, LRR and PYD domains-containing protein 3-like isoform X2 [Polypterus senegalus]
MKWIGLSLLTEATCAVKNQTFQSLSHLKMSEYGLNKKFTSMIIKKGRSDEDVATHSGLLQKFSKVIKQFHHEDLLRITEYYKPQLAYVIEYDITSILQNLVTKQILTNDEAKKCKTEEKAGRRVGVEYFIKNMMKKDRQVLVSLWEALGEELVKFPSPNMTRILEEVTDMGLDVLLEIQSSPIEPLIEDLHKIHRKAISKSTRTLEDQPSSGDPCPRVMSFETRYIELMIFKQYRKTYCETQHELLKTGRTHAELVEERTKEKCERLWIQQLFRRNPECETFPNIVVVSGVAGIGKTTMVQKILFDWSRGTHHQKFAFVFLFKFRDLNLLDNENEPQMPLTRLIVRHYSYLNDPKLREILKKPETLLFIFDGLDEYKHQLDFTQKKLCSDPETFFPVHVLITSLVSQTLLKGCTILITSRPTALETIDMTRADRFAEILGFFPEQRLMYFKRFFGDTDLGTEAFLYIEEKDILYTMCFNPSYCQIICSVLKSHFNKPEEERGAAPSTVTELFVMFLQNILTNHKRDAEDQQGILVKLGKMAYYGIVNKMLVFYDHNEMSTFGLQPLLPSSFLSGFLKEILQKESTLEHTTYTFFHLTLQEFMAACCFYLDPLVAVEELLRKLDSCEDGRFEIFTRFLAGLARYDVFKKLEGIMGKFKMKNAKQILKWIKQKAERAIQVGNKSEALRVCQWLYESQNRNLIRDAIGKDLKMNFSGVTLSPLDCAVLGSVISCCGELQELDISDTNFTAECIGRLKPGLIRCRRVVMEGSRLTAEYCEALFLLLSAEYSRLTELQVGYNTLEDSGLGLLCDGMRNSNCKLEELGLPSCGLTSGCGAALSAALSSRHSCLTVLYLRDNKIEDSGICQLCEGLKNPNCKLKTINLRSCGLTSGSCETLSSALSTGHSRLIGLNLRENNLGDSGMCLLCEGLKNKDCKLETINLSSCGLTSGCCSALSSALSTEHLNLTELWLAKNKLEDSGVYLLCEGLRNPNCKLQKLGLSSCHLTTGCCSALSLAFSAKHSKLTGVWLGYNKLEDSGVSLLCEGLRNTDCKLEKLWLESCGLTSGCCQALSSVLSTGHSNLTELELNFNKLDDSGVHLLCEGLRNAICKLKKLEVRGNKISEDQKRNLKSLEEEMIRLGVRVEIIT